MTDYFFNLIQQFLFNYGAPAVFAVNVLEEIIFIIPSNLVFLTMGFFLIPPSLPFWTAFGLILAKITLWAALGVTLGSLFVYGIFYWGGKLLVDKFGKYFGISGEAVEKVERKFSAGFADELTVFLLRALPVWPITITSAFCGLIRLSWKTFLVYTFLGIVFRTTLLALVGWQLGETYLLFADKLSGFEKYGTISLIILLAIFLFYAYKKNKG